MDPAIRRAGVLAALSLPRPALRLIAGGSVVYKGGRTLDPRLQFLAWRARRAPRLADLTAQEARLTLAEQVKEVGGRLAPGVSVESLAFEAENGVLRARAYRPAAQDPAAPLLVFAHGGGGVIGNLDSSHAFCGALAVGSQAPVLSVDYRLAPEDRFPAGLDDLLAAYRWARTQAPRFGAPPGRAAIGGEGIGGNFAAVICQELRRHGEPQPVLQLLVYPIVDMASESASVTTYADAFPLSRALMAWLVGHYLGPEDDPAEPRLSPLRARSLRGLAPAVVAAAGHDPMVDQALAYARGLGDAGTPTVYRCYDSLAHGFAGFTGAVPTADAACREIAAQVRAALLQRSDG